MGAYLSAPVTTKESTDGENDLFRYGVSAMQGWRTDMEDAHAVVLDVDNEKTGFFAVFDGHGGKEVAKFAAKYLAPEVARAPGYGDGKTDEALTHAFLKIDQLLLREERASELAALRGEDEAGGDGGGGGGAPMVINGAHLPEGLLEALGMPSGGGFQIKLVRSGPGGRNVTIDDIEEEGGGREDSDRSSGAVFELNIGGPREDDDDYAAAEQESSGEEQEGEEDEGDAKEDAADDRAGGKRKRDEKSMDIDPVETDKPGSSRAGAKREGDEKEEEDAATDAKAGGEGEYQGPSAGCTAVCAVVRGTDLVVANAGDSRCVLSRKGTAVALTHDHKPTDEEEYSRIIKAGGFVADGRVNGSLNLSRALGDMEYKQNKDLGPDGQMVTAVPEVRRETLQPGDEFLLLACDGVWDVLTNQEAIDFVRARLLEGKDPKQICEEVCDHCLAPNTGGCGKGCDNMSVVIVVLKAFAEQLANVQAAAGPSKS